MDINTIALGVFLLIIAAVIFYFLKTDLATSAKIESLELDNAYLEGCIENNKNEIKKLNLQLGEAKHQIVILKNALGSIKGIVQEAEYGARDQDTNQSNKS